MTNRSATDAEANLFSRCASPSAVNRRRGIARTRGGDNDRSHPRGRARGRRAEGEEGNFSVTIIIIRGSPTGSFTTVTSLSDNLCALPKLKTSFPPRDLRSWLDVPLGASARRCTATLHHDRPARPGPGSLLTLRTRASPRS